MTRHSAHTFCDSRNTLPLIHIRYRMESSVLIGVSHMDRSSSSSPSRIRLLSVLHGCPQAVATIAGSAEHPSISGVVRLYQTGQGVVVLAEITGLPKAESPCQQRIFGFHIHSGTNCGGNMDDPFADAMSHYDPVGCEHPHHAGDLPPLFGNDGLALSLCLTNRFSVNEVLGRTIILHDHPDDFTTQPSGNSGEKIACGVIRKAC